MQAKTLDIPIATSNGFQALASTVVKNLAHEHPTVKKHCERVATLSARLAHAMGLSEIIVKEAEVAGALHDIGKVNLAAEIITKPAELDPDEMRSIREIPLHSATIARLLGFSTDVQRAISQRHERPDGKGYPYGLNRERISTLAKIVAIADTYDSLTHDQPYRKGCSAIEAIGIIRSKCFTHFDPEIVDHFTTITLPPAIPA